MPNGCTILNRIGGKLPRMPSAGHFTAHDAERPIQSQLRRYRTGEKRSPPRRNGMAVRPFARTEVHRTASAVPWTLLVHAPPARTSPGNDASEGRGNAIAPYARTSCLILAVMGVPEMSGQRRIQRRRPQHHLAIMG